MSTINMEAVLEEMRATFGERNEKYSENWRAMGPVMSAIFPDGITLRTNDDFIKFALFEWAIGKLVRFGRTGMTHKDGVLDAAVYCAILKGYLDAAGSE